MAKRPPELESVHEHSEGDLYAIQFLVAPRNKKEWEFDSERVL